MTPALQVRFFINSSSLILLITLVSSLWAVKAEAAASANCLVPPAFDPGAGELYFCSPQEGERHLIEYARQSYVKEELKEDIWINFRGVFGDRLWVNVGTRETNDTSLPAWEAISGLVERMKAIKKGDSSVLQAFLAPIEGAAVDTEEGRVLKQRLLEGLRQSAVAQPHSAFHAALYHVHLKPTREIEEKSLMPINHYLSIPSHMDLLYAPRLSALIPGAESKIAVAAGIWTYNWDEKQGRSFVTERYDGPKNVPFPGEFGYVYSRFAITEYHRQGLNDPANVTPQKVAEFITTLKPSGAILRLEFAPDWEAFKNSITQGEQGK